MIERERKKKSLLKIVYGSGQDQGLSRQRDRERGTWERERDGARERERGGERERETERDLKRKTEKTQSDKRKERERVYDRE